MVNNILVTFNKIQVTMEAITLSHKPSTK